MSDPEIDPIGGSGAPNGDAPRRAASARFDVAGRGDGDMRDALDPATHSLGEALKLSYRVLQLGIVGLVVVFLFSGFQSVKEGDTGVKTLFGAIAGEQGAEQLQPGLQPFWPYPVGDLEVFAARRQLSLKSEFWPSTTVRGQQGARTMEDQINAADPNAGIDPALDGSLITREGDIVHAQFESEYQIADAVRFLGTASPQRADELVRSAIMRSAIETASGMTLAEFTDTRDSVGPAVRERAQRVLDRLGSGIELTSVRGTERVAPFAVQNRFREVQIARENSKTVIERARQDASTMLTQLSGGALYEELLAIIREYEQALEGGKVAESEAILVRLGERMEREDVGGEISRIVARAKATESGLRASLEREARRVDSLAASFRDSSSQVVRQLWLDALREVLENPQAEVFATSDLVGRFNLAIASSNEVMQGRRDAEIQRKKAEEEARNAGGFYAPDSERIFLNKAGRRLKRDASGSIGSIN
ncbi:MAG: SPFH domain-containing protein [Planctomycetota bacterium]